MKVKEGVTTDRREENGTLEGARALFHCPVTSWLIFKEGSYQWVMVAWLGPSRIWAQGAWNQAGEEQSITGSESGCWQEMTPLGLTGEVRVTFDDNIERTTELIKYK